MTPAAVGLAGGAAFLGNSVTPFLLRGINTTGHRLGVCCRTSGAAKRGNVWRTLFQEDAFDRITTEVSLSDVPTLGRSILAGQVRGRVMSGRE